jgi:hypothetical protein
MTLEGKTPTQYWIVAALGALWNAFGGYDYWMAKSRNLEYLSQMGNADEILSWMDSFPIWAQIGYGLGVWGSVLGSVLMLMRSRFAPAAFLVSLVGAIVSFTAQFMITPPASLDTPFSKILPVVIIGIVVFLWWYSKRAATKGLLR